MGYYMVLAETLTSDDWERLIKAAQEREARNAEEAKPGYKAPVRSEPGYPLYEDLVRKIAWGLTSQPFRYIKGQVKFGVPERGTAVFEFALIHPEDETLKIVYKLRKLSKARKRKWAWVTKGRSRSFSTDKEAAEWAIQFIRKWDVPRPEYFTRGEVWESLGVVQRRWGVRFIPGLQVIENDLGFVIETGTEDISAFYELLLGSYPGSGVTLEFKGGSELLRIEGADEALGGGLDDVLAKLVKGLRKCYREIIQTSRRDISLEEAEAIAADPGTDKPTLVQLAVERFGASSGRSKLTKAALIKKLQTFIRNERIHQAIARAAGGKND